MRTPAVAFSFLLSGGIAHAHDVPFAGTWDCEGSTISFTADTYDNGIEEQAITRVQKSPDGIYGVFVGDATFVTISDVTDSTIRWTAGDDSGLSLACSRLASQ